MMMNEKGEHMVTFEHPLNERMRLFLRIEHLFDRIHHHLQQASFYDQQTVINLILELAELTNRGDIKTDVIKELDRQHQDLSTLVNEQNTQQDKLEQLLQQQQQLLNEVYDSDGKLTDNIRSDELLSTIKQRTGIAGGGCSFDAPIYHLWLHLPSDKKQASIEFWLQSYQPLRKAIKLCLDIIRLSCDTQEITAEEGFYNDTLEPSTPLQLIKVSLPESYRAYPEISAGKHRLSIRFFEVSSTLERPKPLTQDIKFTLSRCIL